MLAMGGIEQNTEMEGILISPEIRASSILDL